MAPLLRKRSIIHDREHSLSCAETGWSADLDGYVLAAYAIDDDIARLP